MEIVFAILGGVIGFAAGVLVGVLFMVFREDRF